MRRRSVAALVSALLGLGLAGCGFQPLYATPESAAIGPVNDLASVHVSPLQDHTGQIFHNLLRDRLNPSGLARDPAYILTIELSESIEELAVRADETATRGNLRLNANFVLSRRDNDQVLFSGESRAVTSFNILRSQFATYTSEEDARKRGLRELSNNIRVQLATFFSRVRTAGLS